MDQDIYLTVTAEAVEAQRGLEQGTPPAPSTTDEHNGSGRGQGGHGQGSQQIVTRTPEAASTPDANP